MERTIVGDLEKTKINEQRRNHAAARYSKALRKLRNLRFLETNPIGNELGAA